MSPANEARVEMHIVEVALPETPESLYHDDQTRMRIDAFRRRVHPDLLAVFDEVEETILQGILSVSSSSPTSSRGGEA